MPLTEYEKQMITGRVQGPTRRFGGYYNDAKKRGLITQRLKPSKLMSTTKTWRACRNCCTPAGNTKIVSVHDQATGLLFTKKCGICGGKGMVFG